MRYLYTIVITVLIFAISGNVAHLTTMTGPATSNDLLHAISLGLCLIALPFSIVAAIAHWFGYFYERAIENRACAESNN